MLKPGVPSGPFGNLITLSSEGFNFCILILKIIGYYTVLVYKMKLYENQKKIMLSNSIYLSSIFSGLASPKILNLASA